MLATAGVAVGHMVGYVIAHPAGNGRAAALGGGHGYLPITATFVVPVGVVAALWWAVRTARDLGIVGTLDWRHLAAAQVALFTLQEVGVTTAQPRRVLDRRRQGDMQMPRPPTAPSWHRPARIRPRVRCRSVPERSMLLWAAWG